MADLILGAGMTGLAAGLAADLPVYEALAYPGGICSSYYMHPDGKRVSNPPAGNGVYRFETGGGHWIFGGDAHIVQFLRAFDLLRPYERHSGVWFPERRLHVPYPLQDHLRFLPTEKAIAALSEIAATPPRAPVCTMAEWLERNFGKTLCEEFFFPFHDLYTASLYRRIAPQDPNKSPAALDRMLRGAFEETGMAGYNATFHYPENGLDALACRMAERLDVRYHKRAVRIDAECNTVEFADGSNARYGRLLTTLPLNRTLEMAGLDIREKPDPYSSVLVLNIGAHRDERCPQDHWLYHDQTEAGFHRTGFYSNVDESFVPSALAVSTDRVGIYVERAYPGGSRPGKEDIEIYKKAVVEELRDWGFIGRVDVIDDTWIDVAYTWHWPGSEWRENAIAALQEHDIYPIGRYGRWVFQGIADSIREGLYVGAAFRRTR